jgi:hypothetical protein
MKKQNEMPIHFKTMGDPNEIDGQYVVPHPTVRDYLYLIIASTGEGWEHVSVTLHKKINANKKTKIERVERCPKWQEMVFLKDMFWMPHEAVVQFHPPMGEYINNHPYCLHLWRAITMAMPIPDKVLVGIQSEKLNELVSSLELLYPGHEKSKYLEALYYADIAKEGTPQFEMVIKEFFPTL